MTARNDRARTLIVGFGIIAVVASLAGYFAWRAGEAAGHGSPTSAPSGATSH